MTAPCLPLCAAVCGLSGLGGVPAPVRGFWAVSPPFGRGYSPKWIDGKKRSRNVYAHTREECEEKLVVLIREMKAELAQLKAQAG